MKKLIATAVTCSLFSFAATADEQIMDDLIVDGSVCTGFDCNPGEAFGFDTLRLKENNVRIRFFDTSNSASFPSTDWELMANESSNGGLNRFSINNVDAGSSPFTVLGTAPNNGFWLGDNGFVGLGNNSPTTNLHITSGNMPGIRLEQDNSGGFPAQTWDIMADENNLVIEAGGTPVFTLSSTGALVIPNTLTAGNPGSNFPDYVFESNYNLMPLDQLQSYITSNKHLPGIPSASEVAANGINMTELQVNLLKKVEELTLYTLQQQAVIDGLKAQVEQLSNQ